MKKLKLITKRLYVLVLIGIAIGFLIIPCAHSFEQLFRDLLTKINVDLLNNKYITYINYYNCVIFLWILLSCYIFIIYCNWKFLNNPKMDAKYLKEILKNDSPNLPAVSREDLLLKVIGGKNTVKNVYERMITGYIDDNIEPIKKFLKSKTENVLIIDSIWGSGKQVVS